VVPVSFLHPDQMVCPRKIEGISGLLNFLDHRNDYEGSVLQQTLTGYIVATTARADSRVEYICSGWHEQIVEEVKVALRRDIER